MSSRRVRVAGDLFHGQVPAGAVYVGRPAPGLPGSRWANPHRVGRPCRRCPGVIHDAESATAAYDADLTPIDRTQIRADLAGCDLACWCRLPDPGQPDHCHARILIEVANPDLPDRLHENLRQWLALGGDVAGLASLMAMREADASAAIDRTGHARTYAIEPEETT